MKSMILYIGAAGTEIAGCFAFWAWLRMGKSALWLLPGCASLLVFAYLLTWVDASGARLCGLRRDLYYGGGAVVVAG
jgi:small multidrug resistance family-3 protein